MSEGYFLFSVVSLISTAVLVPVLLLLIKRWMDKY